MSKHLDSYLKAAEQAFEDRRDPEKALQMSRYMRYLFPFYGLHSPLRKEITRHIYSQYGLPDPNQHLDFAKKCWEKKPREFQYFGMETLHKIQKYSGDSFHETISFCCMNKSWWDSVDFIASHMGGTYMKQYPGQRDKLLDQWMESGHMWLQRLCLLFQLKYKKQTDVVLLEKLISQLQSHPDFFIRKAIGWILREYSKTDAQWVVQYVDRHKGLSPLSRNEALKWIKSQSK